jgi:hypothetical protein
MSAQYTSKDFAELARANGVVLSVGRKGECWDNAVAESFGCGSPGGIRTGSFALLEPLS